MHQTRKRLHKLCLMWRWKKSLEQFIGFAAFVRTAVGFSCLIVMINLWLIFKLCNLYVTFDCVLTFHRPVAFPKCRKQKTALICGITRAGYNAFSFVLAFTDFQFVYWRNTLWKPSLLLVTSWVSFGFRSDFFTARTRGQGTQFHRFADHICSHRFCETKIKFKSDIHLFRCIAGSNFQFCLLRTRHHCHVFGYLYVFSLPCNLWHHETVPWNIGILTWYRRRKFWQCRAWVIFYAIFPSAMAPKKRPAAANTGAVKRARCQQVGHGILMSARHKDELIAGKLRHLCKADEHFAAKAATEGPIAKLNTLPKYGCSDQTFLWFRTCKVCSSVTLQAAPNHTPYQERTSPVSNKDKSVA